MSEQTGERKTLMSVRAVREYLGVSRPLALKFLEGVPAVRIGKMPRYDKDDVDRAYAEMKRPA
ncbi:hypothetical protein [Falsiroseomonas sp. CW058]|uniref:hypothetical protein n=1 Tax=Falsiroseomonas sp. CW058 TaxID=3388664 RepID=UPI003D323FCC